MLQNLVKKIFKTPSTKNGSALMDTFSRLPVSFVRGEGCYLFDQQGKRYLDAIGGIAVTALGHCHPKISETISLQASKLLHVSNLFEIQEQSLLADKFCQIAEMDKVFFCNSGAEANEAAIKLARAYGNKKGIKNPTIITANGSFHGRTMATLSASGNEAIKSGFTPVLEKFIYVDFNDINALKAHIGNPDVVAVLMEPIQGESGIIIPDDDYLNQLRQLCDEQQWLLMLDEIQSGMGRTGKWFAYQHSDIKPDVITSAKALGNGIPIGACAARGKAAQVFTPGSHGSTFGGSPFACQVALKTIQTIESEDCLHNGATVGEHLQTQLSHNLTLISNVIDIRAKGMMLAVELEQSIDNLAERFLEQGLVVNITGGGKIIRLLPALNMTEKQASEVADIILKVLNQ